MSAPPRRLSVVRTASPRGAPASPMSPLSRRQPNAGPRPSMSVLEVRRLRRTFVRIASLAEELGRTLATLPLDTTKSVEFFDAMATAARDGADLLHAAARSVSSPGGAR